MKKELNEVLAEKIKLLPEQPGVYRFLNKEGKIIYIGKAKILKNRVSSYFVNRYIGRKTQKLVQEIHDLEYTVVESEFDALLLENNLIKVHQPKYNILLKDDKTYPFICISNERYPRVFPTRQRRDDGSRYFGPYASVKMMNALLELFRQLYPLRTCHYVLSEENIKARKFKVCLEYHIKNCLGPCEGLQDEENYNKNIQQIIHILKGNLTVVKNFFKEKMQEAASAWKFEEAEIYKQKLELVSRYQEKSLVANPEIQDLEVYTILKEDESDTAYVNFIKITNGCIIQTESVEICTKLDETAEEILGFAITDFRKKFQTAAPKVIVNIQPDIHLPNTEIVVPKVGDMRKLVELSIRNATYFKKERESAKIETALKRHKNTPLLQLKADLNLKELPRHIECFDNSNLQGTNAVAAMVCFKDGKPSKRDYRHFTIKTVEGPNDFDSMYEIVYRRYKRLLDEGQELPQLVVIDGGKGQLNAAVRALQDLNISEKIAIIGIAKRLEEIFFPGDSEPLQLNRKSRSLVLLQKIRDEAHRFGVIHHRNKRSKAALHSELDEIKGIGEKTKQVLLLHFKSVSKIREATRTELIQLIGEKKADILIRYFSQQNSERP
ncbi:MAG: excinuclease ABC subunit UvrC [Cytophagales bacterium]|nr:excinuclease ABC subunit UvrC [Cytophagales bacterium]MDW8384494.1 excinuclease ABC subunit UvrC [Flammeovirgaceae bacterium]